MEPAEIISTVNRENEKLSEENQSLRQENAHLSDQVAFKTEENAFLLAKFNEDLAMVIYEATHAEQTYCDQIKVLETLLTQIGSSKPGAAASEASIALLQERLRQAEKTGESWIEDVEKGNHAIIGLQQKIAEMNRRSEQEQTKIHEQVEELTQLEQQRWMAKRQEVMLTIQLEKASKHSTRLISARDDLNHRLAVTVDKMATIQQKNSTKLRELSKMKKSLSNELQVTTQELQENQDHNRSLRKQIEKASQESEDLQRSLTFYHNEGKHQDKMISKLQIKVRQLKDTERAVGLKTKIRDLEVDRGKWMEKFEELKKKSEKELRKESSLRKKLEEKLKQAQEHEAYWKGNALGYAGAGLDKFTSTKLVWGKKILDDVFNNLRDIDSEKKAKLALTCVKSSLLAAQRRNSTILQEEETKFQEIKQLIQSLTEKVKQTTTTPKDLERLIETVADLRLDCEAEIKKDGGEGK